MSDRCYNCGNDEFTALYSARSFDSDNKTYILGSCNSCHLVNTLAASKTDISNSYSQSYYRSSTSKFTGLIETALSYITKLKANDILENWRKHSGMGHKPSVLDIGCGRGKLLREFDNLGANTQGLERQEFPINDLNLNIHIGDLSDSYFNDKKYDVIVLWHVLEHLENTESLISDIVNHMHANSNLIISVPNFSSFQQKLFGRNWFHLDLPRHLIHFEPDWLISRLESHGLTIEKISYFDPIQNIYGFIQSSLNYLSPGDSNEFYKMLQYKSQRKGIKFFILLLLAALLAPFAFIESIVCSIAKCGSTVTITTRSIPYYD
jgi:SAM-dependent methyltransferase